MQGVGGELLGFDSGLGDALGGERGEGEGEVLEMSFFYCFLKGKKIRG